MKKSVALLFLCLVPTLCFAQWRKDSIIPADLLLGDLDQLYETIMASHTDPGRYCTQAELDAAFDRARAKAEPGLSPVEWLKVVCQTMAIMQDSHSSPEIGSFFNDFVKDNGRALTFGVHSLPNGLYVSNDMLHILPPGAKIISISGRPALDIAAEIAGFGFTEGLANVSLSRVRDMIFQRIYALIAHPLPDFVPIVVQPADDSENVHTYYYPAKTVKELRKIQNRLPIEDRVSERTFEVDYRGDTLAHVTIRSFSASGQGRYNRFLRNTFEQIAARPGIETLVIDLRNNPGGSSGRMRTLASYLIPDALVIPKFVAFKQSDLTYERNGRKYKGLRKNRIDKWARKDEDANFYKNLCALPIGQADTFFYQSAEMPRDNLFEGEKVLLINGLSGSASVAFAGIFKENKAGIIIGEPCMGPMSGTWGNALPFTLENTGLRVFLSTIRYAVMGDYSIDPSPILPDIAAPYTPAMLRNREDPAWEKISRWPEELRTRKD